MFLIHVLLAYQLEQYDATRFLKFIYQRPIFWIKWSQRQNIDWTNKMIVLFVLSLILWIWLNIVVFDLYWWFVLVSFCITILCYPILILASNALISPIDWIIKKIIVYRAKSKLKQHPQLKIIGITWSYWKTSTKEYLKTILSSQFNVIATPWTHNTELWISNFILKYLKKDTQILLLEMWAYLPWDIQKLCNISQLDVWVITGITEQHLERFENISNIIKTKFELTKNIKTWWLFVFDTANPYIKVWIDTHKNNLKTIKQIWIWKLNVSYVANLWGIEFVFDTVKYVSKLLWKHNATNLALAISIAKSLWMKERAIQLAVSHIDFVPHRLQLIQNNNGVYVVDDSFNGNIEWVKSTIDLLQNTHNARKLYLTPWLVELWDKAEEVHIEIGKLLSNAVDKVLLIQNSTTKYIKEWLLENGFNPDNIKIYDTALKAHEDLKNILQKWDIIVFQNDWTDNYI